MLLKVAMIGIFSHLPVLLSIDLYIIGHTLLVIRTTKAAEVVATLRTIQHVHLAVMTLL